MWHQACKVGLKLSYEAFKLDLDPYKFFINEFALV
jgi:hypothetical protein